MNVWFLANSKDLDSFKSEIKMTPYTMIPDFYKSLDDAFKAINKEVIQDIVIVNVEINDEDVLGALGCALNGNHYILSDYKFIKAIGFTVQ